MVQISGGKFMMGDKNEVDAPPHEVVVDSFLMDRHLVTQEQFQKVMSTNPSRWKGEKNPVEQLRWSDAVKFCNKRSELEGLQPCYDLKSLQCNFDANGYRLPTEAEWEYACRAGTTTGYFFGDNPAKLGDYAWFDKNSGGHPRPAGQKQPNPWGLYDIHGNVAEWVLDQYDKNFYASLKHGARTISPVMLPTERRYPNSVRGGSWDDEPARLRSAARRASNKDWSRRDPQVPQSIWWHTEAITVGFCVVRPLDEQENLKGLRSKVTKQSPN